MRAVSLWPLLALAGAAQCCALCTAGPGNGSRAGLQWDSGLCRADQVVAVPAGSTPATERRPQVRATTVTTVAERAGLEPATTSPRSFATANSSLAGGPSSGASSSNRSSTSRFSSPLTPATARSGGTPGNLLAAVPAGATVRSSSFFTAAGGASVAPAARAGEEALLVRAGAAEAASRAAAEKLRESGRARGAWQTEAGWASVYNLDSAPRNAPFTADGVQLPPALLQSLPPRSVLALLRFGLGDGSRQDVLEGRSQRQREAIDISIYDGDGRRVEVADQEQPLLFRLPAETAAACAYLEGGAWSGRGTWRATDEELLARGVDPAGTWCFTQHLSIFSGEGIDRIGDSAWHKSSSAVSVFIVCGIILFIFLLGLCKEVWWLRLGTTEEVAAEGNLCRALRQRYIGWAKDFRNRQQLKVLTLRVGLTRFLAVRTGVSSHCVTEHCWDSQHWTQPRVRLPKTVLMRKLEFHGGWAETVWKTELKPLGVNEVIWRLLFALLACHPLVDVLRVGDVGMNVWKRTALLACGIFGVLATDVLFFDAFGPLSGWHDFSLTMVTFGSVAFNAFLTSFLEEIGKHAHGRPPWLVCFWVISAIYLAASIFFVLVGLANLSQQDNGKLLSSIQLSVILKLIVVPLAFGLIHFGLLELFLSENRCSTPRHQFATLAGFRHHAEKEVPEEIKSTYETIAAQSISAEELLSFAALLGEKTMFDFKPETSTTEEVLRGAIRPLCHKPGTESPVIVTVHGALGLRQPSRLGAENGDRFSCSVLHLGRLIGSERYCVAEHKSPGALAVKEKDGSTWGCRWMYEVSVQCLKFDHAICFAVREEGRDVGIALLPVEEILRRKGWCGDLRLLQVEDRNPNVVMVPLDDVSDPPGTVIGPRLTVTVTLPYRFLETLLHQSGTLENAFSAPNNADPYALKVPNSSNSPSTWRKAMDGDAGSGAGGAAAPATPEPGARNFCATFLKASRHPDKVVVHSQEVPFFHLVASLIVDALGKLGSRKDVQSRLLARDFQGLHSMLELAEGRGTRYWIDIFAIDPTAFLDGKVDWHKRLLRGWPLILRSMRKAACARMVADIEAGREPGGFLEQLLVVDRSWHLFHCRFCLTELMLAEKMCVGQRFLVHPDDLTDAVLSEELKRLAIELAGTFRKDGLLLPVLDDRHGCYDAVKKLLSQCQEAAGEKQGRQSWKGLDMADIVAVVGAWEHGEEDAEHEDDDSEVVSDTDP